MGIMTTPKNDDFIAFLSDEERFIVVDPRGLEKEVLTEYFDEDVSTYDQFVEMLDRWGFEVVEDENAKYPCITVYKHELFKKGDWEGCLKIGMGGTSSSSNDKTVVETSDEEVPVELPKKTKKEKASPSKRKQKKQTKSRSVTPPSAPKASQPPATAPITFSRHPSAMNTSKLIESSLLENSPRLYGLSSTVTMGTSLEEAMTIHRSLQSRIENQVLRASARFGLSGAHTMPKNSDIMTSHLHSLGLFSNDSSTNHIATAAINASNEISFLRINPQCFGTATTNTIPSLDAMTERFLERSTARIRRTSPLGNKYNGICCFTYFCNDAEESGRSQD